MKFWITLFEWILSLLKKKELTLPEPPKDLLAPPTGEIKPSKPNLNLAVLEVAKSFLGVHEQGGNNRGPEVNMFLKSVGLDPGNAWCMAYVAYCVKQVEKKSGVESDIYDNSAHCLTVWRESPAACKIPKDKVQPGDVVIWQKGMTENGHTGIVHSVESDGIHFRTYEGNTDADDGQVNREGDEVAFKRRPFGAVGSMHIVGFLRPFIG